MKPSITVERLCAGDYQRWLVLAKGYKEFYKTPITDAEISETWGRLLADKEIHGVGARLNGELVGIAHYLFHTTIWAPRSCYLQDLFTAQEARGRGAARHLIEYVADHAKSTGVDRYYWNTQESNETARTLYDKLAEYKGFIRYDFPVQ